MSPQRQSRVLARCGLRAAALGLCATLMGCGPEPVSEEPQLLRTQESDLYVSSSAIWPTKRIPVCWENPSYSNQVQRDWVRNAVEGTWDAQSGVDFVGWNTTCTATSPGIRIRIADEQPLTWELGRWLSGYPGGMVLNFTFRNWETSCQGREEYCIRLIAVHEFGHALGFAHEHNRLDTPSSCTEPRQGRDGDVTIGPWDLDSVMNYCNPEWSGNGQLSALDIMGVQMVYGRSQDVGVIPNALVCPPDSEMVTVFMDDEDNANANSASGWRGATESGTDTRFRFCRTDGNAFKALGTTGLQTQHYAVLKLGHECPAGSTEFSRYFDNEDDGNRNSWSASHSSTMGPNTSNRNTRLVFCLFTSAAQTMSAFPDLGTAYGVFAAGDFEKALATGWIHTDDEDSNNENGYTAPASSYSAATRIVTAGTNTDLRMARVR